MRQIGLIDTESQARVFRSYLLTLGIHADIDQTRDNRWAVWVHEETRLNDGRRELEQFLLNPRDERYQAAAKTGQDIEQSVKKEEKQYKGRQVDLRTDWYRRQMAGGGTVTLSLIFVSVALTLLSHVSAITELFYKWLYIMDLSQWPYTRGLLYEVMHGQVWRLITPIFLHAKFFAGFGILHILFNMLWLKQLGGDVEAVEGSGKLALHVMAYAILGNVLQVYFSGPVFGGMSGVVYGLLAFVWIMGYYTNEARYQIEQGTIIMMMVWFVLCWTGTIGNIANWAHTGGLVAGAIWATIKLRRIPFTAIRF